MEWTEIVDLTKIFKENGDKILDASSKLSLSTSLLRKMNGSFKSIFRSNETQTSNFHVTSDNENIIEQFLDLQLLYDFVQKTIALKIYSEDDEYNNQTVDISLFKNLKLLEIHRFSSSILTGLKNLRSQLEYLICIRSIKNLKDVLENCGGDKVQGFLWNELREAVFRHNSLDDIDGSLEFVPQLSSIDLSHNRIQNAQYINCLSNLQYLNLGFNQIETVPVFNKQLCDSLQVLVLRNNYIDDIKELAVLVNLCELDLSNNCLIEHNQLIPLNNLENLQRLVLIGNPLSYHPKHRRKTLMYMHIKAPMEFLLDNTRLSSSEVRKIGTIDLVSSNFDRSSSLNSITSINTVVPACTIKSTQNTIDLTSDMDISDGSSLSNNHGDMLYGSWSKLNTRNSEDIGMQDSGFVAEPRRMSSSYCSIGSAASLNNKIEIVRNCESDIEILSNPSQSSIEVISSRSIPKHTSMIRETNSTKKDVIGREDVMRKSL